VKIAVLLRAVFEPELAWGVHGGSYLLDGPSLVALGIARQYRGLGGGTEITGIAVGPEEWDIALRDAIALGTDEVRRAWGESLETADVPGIASAAARMVPDGTRLIVAGDCSTDHGSGLLGAAIAETLGWGYLSNVTAVTGTGEEIEVVASGEGGRRRRYRAKPPLVFSAARMPVPAVYPSVARRWAARKVRIPCSEMEMGHPGMSTNGRLELVGYGPARPLMRQLLKPSANSNSGQRLKQLMSGGMSSRGGQSLKGADTDVAGQLSALLVREGFLQHDGDH
jgi:electron transfer flavoprotein alpha/beta subunit